jgi:Holliday junction resolvase RusA-like endonuclease
MGRHYEFFIRILPEPKQSVRSTVLLAKCRTRIHHHQTRKITENAEAMRGHILEALNARGEHIEPMEGPVTVDLLVTFPPRQCDGWWQNLGRKWWPKDTAPDGEQLAKQVLDVLESLRFFKNDAQVWRLTVEKVFGEPVGTRVTMLQWEPPRL